MIRWWMSIGFRGRRALILDAALIGLAIVTAWSVLVSDEAPIDRHRVALLVVSTAAILIFLGRRGHPLLVSLASFAAWLVTAAISPVSTAPMFVGVLAGFALCGYLCRPAQAAMAWLAGAGTVGFATVTGLPAEQWLGDFLLSMAFCTALWAAGLLVGIQRRRAERVTAELAAERDQRAAAIETATRDEQARIAVDLHDVVSHGLSVVVVQAVAARESLSQLAPSAAAEALGLRLEAIESSARDGLAEMRRMLGLLQVDHGTDLDAVPSLRLVPKLIEHAKAAGLTVDAVQVTVDRDLPPGADLTAYRVVQEAITNAIKHAPGSRLRVSVTAAGSHPLDVLVENTASPRQHAPSHATGTGRGLIGMQQRARLNDGTLSTEVTAGGGFRVHMTLPVSRP